MKRITHEEVAELEKTNFFEDHASPACVAILPWVQPHFIGAEIGVFAGQSSVLFLGHCQFMYFIDWCEEYEGNSDPGYLAFAPDFLKTIELEGKGRYKFLKMKSEDSGPHVPKLDFAFIDGNHAYEYVKRDLEIYWPKIKAGGFLSGHDYAEAWPEVVLAVDEFFAKLNLEVVKRHYCWIVQKG